ncbi:MAG TPA: SusD/RagB family nutrient-binding outer membrane lipoprotein [Gemmatimonadaceae bacterium]
MQSLRGTARVIPVLLILTLAACENFLDVNDNPNSPETAAVDIRLPALITAFIHSTYYGENSLWGAEWTQQFSYNRETRPYSQVQRYELSETDASSAWDYYYSRPGNASYTLVRDASAPGDIYYHGLGKLFYAWTFEVITDLWGPVPYNEAFKPEIREPKYDSQKTVYEGILASLDTAIADMSSTTGRLPGTNDLLFNGDMSKWIKLAHFLQARTQLRMAYAQGEDMTARANAALTALSGALTSNADDADFIYPGGEDARNPLWMFQDQQNSFVASEYLVEMLKSRSDPRLPIMFTPIVYDSVRGTTGYPSTTPTYVGHPNGGPTLADSTVSWIGAYFSNEDAPLNLVSYADQKFTEAEARLIVSGAAAADAPYREGIRANMTKLGVAAGDIDAYVATRPDLSTATNPLEEIITEKYIANFLKVEPWDDWRRTGYPVLPSPVEQAVLPDIPQRIRTPASELSNNINQVTATGIPIGLDGMSTKLWWAGGSQ